LPRETRPRRLTRQGLFSSHELKVPGEAAHHMAGHIIPLDPRRLTLRLIEIKLRVIEFVFGVDRQMAVHKILRSRQRV
jgi:hypothetical protein